MIEIINTNEYTVYLCVVFDKQKYISIFLSLVIGLFTMKSALVMSYYIVFTDTFIENYCINKDKPELNCDGKCELSKLLERDSSEQDHQEGMMLLTSAEIVFYLSKSQNLFNLSNFPKDNKPAFVFIPQIYAFDFRKKLIKPPEVLVQLKS